jgi:LysM repeat protein
MKQIIHQKVRLLLQTAADQTLRQEEQMVLDTHLVECSECRTYSQNLDQLQDGLRRVMQQQWNVRNTPLALETIKNRSGQIAVQNQMMSAVRKFAFVPMLALVLFMAMSLKVLHPQQASPGMGMVSSNTPDISLLIPKPPVGLTATKLMAQSCSKTTYIVQEHDTLNGIALRHGISKETIAAYNGLASDKIEVNSALVIPLCEPTPVEMTTTPTIPNTIVPSNGQGDPAPRE